CFPRACGASHFFVTGERTRAESRSMMETNDSTGAETLAVSIVASGSTGGIDRRTARMLHFRVL
ncbi:hypothetical protein, partial [Burkholderia multivorans]|uniref:hypothetical protein n=1 Tax=Burkholderia multivorans TaxID=87883 RepID=UPI001C654E32